MRRGDLLRDRALDDRVTEPELADRVVRGLEKPSGDQDVERADQPIRRQTSDRFEDAGRASRPHHRCRLQHSAAVRVEPGEPPAHHGAEAGGQRQRPSLERPRQVPVTRGVERQHSLLRQRVDLFDREQRDSAAFGSQAPRELAARARVQDQHGCDERFQLRLRQRLEHDPAQRRHEVELLVFRGGLGQKAPAEHDEQARRWVRRQAEHEPARRGVGGVEVVEPQQDRDLGGHVAQHVACGAKQRLFASAGRRQGGKPLAQRRDQLAQLAERRVLGAAQPGSRAQRAEQAARRGPHVLALVLRARGCQDQGRRIPVAGPPGELLDETGLADAVVAHDEERGTRSRLRRSPASDQFAERRAASDHVRCEERREAGLAGGCPARQADPLP
jgi:hypothetical protein